MKLLFIHHSTGGNLIHKGKLRKLLYAKTKTIEFWDHGYNLYTWLPMPILKIVANTFTFHTGLSDSEGNTTGVDYDINITNDPYAFEKLFTADPNINSTLKAILSYDVIAFKNCFPATQITSDMQLNKYMENYLKMRAVFDKHTDKLFIPFTPPPMRKEQTKKEYCSLLPIDSHPNKKANMISAPVFVDFITARIHT